MQVIEYRFREGNREVIVEYRILRSRWPDEPDDVLIDRIDPPGTPVTALMIHDMALHAGEVGLEDG